MFFNSYLQKRVAKIIEIALKKNIKISAAESCTGGLLSALFTEISGSSKVFERGFVLYSNEAKSEILDIDLKMIEKYGAVSSEIAILMAKNSLKKSRANLSIAITGIAGPTGSSQEKPIGLVYISCALKNENYVRKFIFENKNRSEIRESSILAALDIIEFNITKNVF